MLQGASAGLLLAVVCHPLPHLIAGVLGHEAVVIDCVDVPLLADHEAEAAAC